MQKQTEQIHNKQNCQKSKLSKLKTVQTHNFQISRLSKLKIVQTHNIPNSQTIKPTNVKLTTLNTYESAVHHACAGVCEMCTESACLQIITTMTEVD